MSGNGRLVGAGLVVALVAAGCSTSTPTLPALVTPTAAATAVVTPAGPTVAATPVSTPTQLVTAAPTGTPAAAHWTTSGELLQSHASTHVVLVSGGKVLIVGDDNLFAPGPPSATEAELWDPATSKWTVTGGLNAPRDLFAAVSLKDGRALITGGVNDNYISYSSTKLYDPSAGTFSQPGLMVYARTSPAWTVLADGRVMAISGVYYNGVSNKVVTAVEIFDPVKGTWSGTGPLNVGRIGAQAVTLADGAVLVVGGTDINSTTLSSAELWDPVSGKWTVIGSLVQARDDFTLVALLDGSALVAGGLNPSAVPETALASAERLDRGTGTWKAAAKMATAAASRISATLANGRILIAGGRVGAWKAAVNAAEIFDPAAGTWTATVPMPMTLERSGAVLLSDGSVLVAGGDGGFVGPVSTPWYPDERLQSIRYFPAIP